MSALYLETSALLTWLLGEPRAEDVRNAVDAAEVVVSSVLTLVEAERALVRAETDGVLVAADAQRLRGVLHRARGGWMLMEITQSVRDRAGRPFSEEPLGTFDALHLATALEFVQVFEDLRVLTFDRRLLANAIPLGLSIEVE